MPNNFQFGVASVETVHFTEALAAASGPGVPPYVSSAMYSIPGVPPIGSRRFLIRSLKVIAKDNFGPSLSFFASAAGQPAADPQADSFIARYDFFAVNGVQFGGAGLWHYYVDGLAIPYQDQDTINTLNPPTLHVILQNIDVTAKQISAAGPPSTGYMKLVAHLEQVMGY